MEGANFDQLIGKELFEAVEERAAFLANHKEDEVVKYWVTWTQDLNKEMAFARAARKYYQKSDATEST